MTFISTMKTCTIAACGFAYVVRAAADEDPNPFVVGQEVQALVTPADVDENFIFSDSFRGGVWCDANIIRPRNKDRRGNTNADGSYSIQYGCLDMAQGLRDALVHKKYDKPPQEIRIEIEHTEVVQIGELFVNGVEEEGPKLLPTQSVTVKDKKTGNEKKPAGTSIHLQKRTVRYDYPKGVTSRYYELETYEVVIRCTEMDDIIIDINTLVILDSYTDDDFSPVLRYDADDEDLAFIFGFETREKGYEIEILKGSNKIGSTGIMEEDVPDHMDIIQQFVEQCNAFCLHQQADDRRRRLIAAETSNRA